MGRFGLASLVLGCTIGSIGCGPDETRGALEHDAGVPPACVAGEKPLEGGGCLPAGVPADRCGQGFVADESAGCHAPLPEAACPPGRLALPGETVCREVAPCPADAYGPVPEGVDVVFVDGSYSGEGSDGTPMRPWTTIGAGVDAASPGGVVAVAAGSYSEAVRIEGKAVRLLGKCPDEVELVGSGTEAPLLVGSGADDSEIGGIALRGDMTWPAVAVSGAERVVVHHVWIHDTATAGFLAATAYGPTSVQLEASLVERVGDLGIVAQGAKVAVEGVVVRDVVDGPVVSGGRGIEVQRDPQKGERAAVTVTRSLVERTLGIGLFNGGCEVTVESTLLRDLGSKALVVEDGDGVAGDLLARQSVVERAYEAGVLIGGANGILEDIVVRETRSTDEGNDGTAVIAQDDPSTGLRGTVLVQRALFADNAEIAVLVIGSDAQLESILIRDTKPRPSDQLGGVAVSIQNGPGTDHRGSAALRWSVLDQNQYIGVMVFGSDLEIASSTIQSTKSSTSGSFGDGIAITDEAGPASVTLRDSRLMASARSGVINFGARVVLQNDTFECNPIHLDGEVSFNPFIFEDLGGNACGCNGVPAECIVTSAKLAPPAKLDR